MSNRFVGENVHIDMNDVESFFNDRFSRINALHPLAAVIYQDNDYELASARDRYEKDTLIPLMSLSGCESILDVGCGIGRWADALYGKVGSYLGTDFTDGFIEVASSRCRDKEKFVFLQADARNLANVGIENKFDIVIIAGLFIYLNDEDFVKVLHNILKLVPSSARIVIREPLALEKRLTLKKVWSEDLNSNYSAIYRSVEEFEFVLNKTLGVEGFKISTHGPLYPRALANRVDTQQFYYILERVVL